MTNTIDWPEFYSEFADKLLEYKDNRPVLIAKIQNVYSALGMPLPRFERYEPPKDIDPFTIFSTFNKGITPKNKNAIMTQLKKEFSITSPIPTSGDGIPVMNKDRKSVV